MVLNSIWNKVLIAKKCIHVNHHINVQNFFHNILSDCSPIFFLVLFVLACHSNTNVTSVFVFWCSKNSKMLLMLLHRVDSEKARASAQAQAEAQTQVQEEVSRILSVERAVAQETLQQAVIRERIATEDEKLRSQLYVSQHWHWQPLRSFLSHSPFNMTCTVPTCLILAAYPCKRGHTDEHIFFVHVPGLSQSSICHNWRVMHNSVTIGLLRTVCVHYPELYLTCVVLYPFILGFQHYVVTLIIFLFSSGIIYIICSNNIK